ASRFAFITSPQPIPCPEYRQRVLTTDLYSVTMFARYFTSCNLMQPSMVPPLPSSSSFVGIGSLHSAIRFIHRASTYGYRIGRRRAHRTTFSAVPHAVVPPM